MLSRAEIGGITARELKTLELSFLFKIDFDLIMSVEDYARITEDLLLFARLRAALLEPWSVSIELAQRTGALATLHLSEGIQDKSPYQCRATSPWEHGASLTTIDSKQSSAEAAKPRATGTADPSIAGAEAASYRAPPGLYCLKRGRAPWPPLGPVTPERPPEQRPWTIRRAEGSCAMEASAALDPAAAAANSQP